MNRNQTNKICVIIPIYNSECYLDECLESVFKQTYPNYDVFLIDDASTDNSLRICESYKRKYRNCYIFNSNRKGPGNARNIGIEQAVQKKEYDWLAFIDSDDIVSIEYLSSLLKCCKKYKTKIGIVKFGNSTKFDSNFISGVMPSIWLFEKRDNFNGFSPLSQSHKLFAISLFKKNIKFPVGKFCEDAYIIPYIILSCKKISFVDGYFYYYRYRYDSQTNGDFNLKKLDEFKALTNLIDYFLKIKNYQAPQYLISRIFVMIARYLYNFRYKWKKISNKKSYVNKLRKIRLCCLDKYNSTWELKPYEKVYRLFKFRFSFTYFLAYVVFKKKL